MRCFSRCQTARQTPSFYVVIPVLQTLWQQFFYNRNPHSITGGFHNKKRIGNLYFLSAFLLRIKSPSSYVSIWPVLYRVLTRLCCGPFFPFLSPVSPTKPITGDFVFRSLFKIKVQIDKTVDSVHLSFCCVLPHTEFIREKGPLKILGKPLFIIF